MTSKISTLVFGSRRESKICLEVILNEFPEYKIVAYVMHDRSPHKPAEDWIANYLKVNRIPIISRSQMHQYNCELGLSLAYDRKLSKTEIDQFPLGIINLHLAPLPMLRGHNGLFHAIRRSFLNGDYKFGFTTHYVNENLDAGEIIEVSDVSIEKDETAYSLCEKAILTLPQLIRNTLKKVMFCHPKKIKDTAPNLNGRYCSIHDIELEIDIGGDPEDIYNHVRALSFPGKKAGFVVIGGHKYALSLHSQNNISS